MSIWNDLEEYGGYSYHGFVVNITIKDDFIHFKFPKGYTPNGNQIDRVAKKFYRLLGREKDLLIFEIGKYPRIISDKEFLFPYDKVKLADAIFHMIIDTN